MQIVIFAVFSVVSLIFVRPLAIKFFFKSGKGRRTNADTLTGKKAKSLKTLIRRQDTAESPLMEMTSGKDTRSVYMPYDASAMLSSLGIIKEIFKDSENKH